MRVRNVSAEGPPLRRLILSCELDNPSDVDICILDAWLHVSCLKGLIIAHGRHFHQQQNLVDALVVPAKGKGSGEIVIPLSTEVLRAIEEKRVGKKDMNVLFHSRIKACYSHNSNTPRKPGLAVPFMTLFLDDPESFNTFIDHPIPQSEWIKLLGQMQCSDLELLELPSGQFSPSPAFNPAISLLKEAQDSFMKGDWKATMLHCRSAVERAACDVTGEDDKGKALKGLACIVGQGKKAKRINALIADAGNFCHLGRHQDKPPVDIDRDDAMLALQVTASLLRYLGRHCPK